MCLFPALPLSALVRDQQALREIFLSQPGVGWRCWGCRLDSAVVSVAPRLRTLGSTSPPLCGRGACTRVSFSTGAALRLERRLPVASDVNRSLFLPCKKSCLYGITRQDRSGYFQRVVFSIFIQL